MKTILLVIGTVILLGLGTLVVLTILNSGPMTKQDATSAIGKLVLKEVEKHETITSGLVFVESKENDYSEYFTYGLVGGREVTKDQPFHVASVGKAFTATLVGVLIDEGKLSLDDKVSLYLEAEVLEELFVFEGNDYSQEVTIRQLMNHTSGIADYFGDKAKGSKDFQTLLTTEPDTFFTPMDLVNFTRDYQKALDKPGQIYHYSDTGYILLGLIIESVSKESFHQMLHLHIFEPLEMKDTYFMFYTEPENDKRPIADVWVNGTNIVDYQSLSGDWAGGGVISTLDDLAVFIRGLNQGEIITKETLDSLYQFDHKFMRGIHYGNGFMAYHFKEFFPTLRSLPVMTGHMGVLGTQMFYDIESDTVYICSFGTTDYSAGSVQTMIKILSYLQRYYISIKS